MKIRMKLRRNGTRQPQSRNCSFVVHTLMSVWTTNEQFLDWGWRVPFLLSFILIFIGLYIRVGILETPVFAKLKTEGRVQKAPVMEVLRRDKRAVILTALLRTGQQTPFYLFTTYVLTY